MPYKIVQTEERGRNILVIVPSLWEEKGMLWWPPKKNQYKLLKNEHSIPNTKEWKKMKCFLKRKDIPTYELADTELSIMEGNSDTDYNDTLIEKQPTNDDINFEALADNLNCNNEKQRNPVTECIDKTTEEVIISQNITNTENETDTENVVQIFGAENLNFDQILANQKILSEKLDNLLQIQTIALENQQKIAQNLAEHSLQLEEISLLVTEMKQSTKVTLLKDAKPEECESFSLKPIQNQRELISMDRLLAEKEQRTKLQKSLSFLCSPSIGAGITCAYKLLDVFFTRDFLCLCSWAGGSRGERSKIAIKDYKNVLKFFHRMIEIWDPTYTSQQNETFFKIITRNSKQRKAMKNLRMSSKRTQKKNKVNNKDSEDTETEKKNMQTGQTTKENAAEECIVEESTAEEFTPEEIIAVKCTLDESNAENTQVTLQVHAQVHAHETKPNDTTAEGQNNSDDDEEFSLL